MQLLLDYLFIFAVIYAAMIVVYFATGLTVTWINNRHPDRRIQKHRDGSKRMWLEIRASMHALATSSVLLSAGYFAQTQGWVLFSPLALSWWSFPLMFAVCFVLFDGWFYWGHRILHLPAFYKWHVPHHKSVAPTVWSNDSSTTIDTLIEHGFYLVVWFVLPVPALSVFALRLFDQISGMVGHSGFEYFASRSSRFPSPLICTTFHDLHHSQFHYNYGNFFSFWDRAMGTVHPKYDALVQEMEVTGAVPDTKAARVENSAA
ncbi:sterol desaturase family protein [Roseibium polysiphoniae]|uniref:Sterol desaturase family protein n=1 Tax=Roseibium polysiphoniae TaxID=2571221 RepID=A0ABR9C626_9HYPH|nr:sterol desaturase family protein [Roseibium polysiphoniae]MBD8875384.1 sterol desaturase family protein [Roseibium polysiphoniae]